MLFFCVFTKMLCYCRLFTDILADSLDSTEIELTKDGHWHVTKTEEADDDTPCHSPKPEQTVEGLQSFCHKLIRAFSFMSVFFGLFRQAIICQPFGLFQAPCLLPSIE